MPFAFRVRTLPSPANLAPRATLAATRARLQSGIRPFFNFNFKPQLSPSARFAFSTTPVFSSQLQSIVRCSLRLSSSPLHARLTSR